MYTYVHRYSYSSYFVMIFNEHDDIIGRNLLRQYYYTYSWFYFDHKINACDIDVDALWMFCVLK